MSQTFLTRPHRHSFLTPKSFSCRRRPFISFARLSFHILTSHHRPESTPQLKQTRSQNNNIIMVAKTNKKKSETTQVDTTTSTATGSGSLEQYLGKTLLLDTTSPPKPTEQVMKGKKLIGMYFTSSWYVDSGERSFFSVVVEILTFPFFSTKQEPTG